MLEETVQGKTHLPVFAVLKWGEWFQTICFDHEKIFSYLQKILNDKTSEN
jgi:hypothetical protein